MKDEIIEAAQAYVKEHFSSDCPECEQCKEITKAIIGAYIVGVTAAAGILAARDGGLTPQNLRLAGAEAMAALGFSL